jgi:putative acetyltransferase
VEDELLGHILFSPIEIKDDAGKFVKPAIALGPVAVLPDHQSKGIGGKLIVEGMHQLVEMGHELCILVGHSDYYPRFGFQQAAQFGLKCQWEVPSPAFMVHEMVPGALAGAAGTAWFRPEFGDG